MAVHDRGFDLHQTSWWRNFPSTCEQTISYRKFVLVDPEGKTEVFTWFDKPQFKKLQEKIREMIKGEAS